MPETSFDERPERSSRFFILEKKGDSIIFRIIDGVKPYKKKVHWVDNKPFDCEIAAGAGTCQYCDLLTSQDEEDQKIGKGQTKYYYLVLDRLDDTTKIFKTTPMVHWYLCEAKEDGYKVYETDWLVKRTEAKGNYYSTKPAPQQQKLTKEDKLLMERAKIGTDLSRIIEGGFESKGLNEPEPGKIDESEKIDPNEVPDNLDVEEEE